MSGIYISGLQMPDKKNGAVLIVYPDGKAVFEDGTKYTAVPVPDHGDLIDRDALYKSDRMVGKLMMFGGEYVYTQTEIDHAPTIIPADGNLYDSLKRGLEQAINGESRSETIPAEEGEG